MVGMEQPENPDSSHTPPPTPPGTPPSAGRSFYTWVRDLGITRSNDDKWFTGVAGGIAARAGIDPLIVRGIFVALTVLGGAGLLIYLAAWLLLPDATGKIYVEEIVHGRATPGVVVAGLIVVLVIAVPVLIGLVRSIFIGPGEWWFLNLVGAPEWVTVTFTVLWWAVLMPAAVVCLVLWLIRRNARNSNDSAADDGKAPGTDWAGQAAQSAAEWGEKAGAQATAWGEKVSSQSANLGQKVDAQATAWESKIRTHHAQTSLGAAHILLTLALGLLAAGGIAAWAISSDTATRVVWLFALIAFVAVCAVSMIVAGVRGKHSGWVGFLAFAGVIALFFTPLSTVLPNDMKVVLLGESFITVDDGAPSESGVLSLAGNVTVDLTDLDENDTGRTVEVWMMAGSVEVLLPADHATRVDIQLIAGNTNEDISGRDSRTTISPFQFRSIDSNTSGAASANITEVRVHMLAGNVDVFDAPIAERIRQSTGVNR